jgi:hypothetical protein
LRRYGPLAAIVALLLIVGAVVLVGGGDDKDEDEPDQSSPGELDWKSPGDTEPGAPAPIGEMPVTYKEADEAGNVDDYDWPDTCDTERGTVKIPSVFAPPCVPAFDGDNGGATTPGVTADSIKIVYYNPEVSADVASLLGAMRANDTPEQRAETLQQFLDVFGSVGQLYGRTVELVSFDASGLASDVVAAQADATDIVAMEPFAVLGGPALDRGTFAQELADAGILCFGCTGAAIPESMALEMAPYVWNALPSPDQILDLLGAWVAALGDEADNAPAERAGGDLKDKPRKLGVIHFEQDPPVFEQTAEDRASMADVALVESYVLDPPTLPAKAAELIAEFKAEGITTITFLGDPLMPIYLLQAATEADYFPEWVFTGTALTDTNIFGRQYDQQQMEHAYGISQLPVPVEQDLQDSIHVYRWYFGDDDALPPAENQYALVAPGVAWLIAGIHMAGPELTPETFARGLFRIPPAGGGPTTPQVSYGNWGYFPEMDYQAIDDAVEIWWDPSVSVEDERGVVGKGAYRRSNGGERFTADESPTPEVFVEEGSVTVLDELSDDDQPPDYPPPEGAPGA